ncbi:MAG TPA: NAD(P)-dependent oxidoreductase [Dehalococcoidales bacterium]|nr:NAD(P)-dependent oxidoreductase [Dehalococcoidales bacterium]
MILLVTGGGGFLGSYVVRDLLKDGHEVVCFDLVAEPTPLMKELIPADLMSRLTMLKSNITDSAAVSETVKKYKPDMIVHFSGVMPPVTEENVPLAIQVNIGGTNNIFEAARVYKVKRVIWSSSNSVLGKAGPAFGKNVLDDKLGIYGPGNFYGSTKVLCELMANQYIKNFGMDIISIRYPRVYGVGKNVGGGAAFTELMANVALEKPIVITGGDTSWDYLYIEDGSLATLKACTVPSTKTKVFNLNDGNNCNGYQLAEILKEINPKAQITVQPGKAQYDFPLVDASAVTRELGFTPRYSLKEGLRMAINYFRKQNHLTPF